MKQFLPTIIFLFSIVGLIQAQCTADYDFGSAGFGVSPDPQIGESFEEAILGEPYEDIIHILVPTSAADIDDSFPPTVEIDSLSLASIDLIDLATNITYTPEEVGLMVTCNNNGDSEDPCTFMGGEQYCALLSGTPTVAGEFQLIITVTGYGFFIVQITENIEFDQYTFTITDPASSIAEEGVYDLELGQNTPNPAVNYTYIPYTLESAGTVVIKVTNLMGEVVYEKNVQGIPGKAKLKIDVSDIPAGIYLYSIEADQKVKTKRMLINK